MTRRVVIDTNVIVSALLNPDGAPARVLALFLNDNVEACYDARILHEYREVLSRAKFPFESADVESLISSFETRGIVIAAESAEGTFTNESDRKFFEVAKTADAILITGNSKHYPSDPCVKAPADFICSHLQGVLL
jgi:putative PIN family toxin of toxin-antitoxin system